MLDVKKFQKTVVKWFLHNGRRYPWRETRSAYHILVAEMLLRQTTARQVANVYEQFLARFPTCTTLAAADKDDVLQIIRCLGIHGRAKALQNAAVVIVRDFGGEVPKCRGDLMTIPGVGPYTADAILCLLFGTPVPLVDSPVNRLLARLCGLDPCLGFRRRQRLACEIAASIMPRRQAREFNLAMLDIGSTICRPSQPECGTCPLATYCCYTNGGAKVKGKRNLIGLTGRKGAL